MKRDRVRWFLAALAVALLVAAVSGAAAQETDLDQFVYLPVITGGQPSAPGANVVANGDFEAGRTAWTEYEDSGFFEFALIVQSGDMPTSITPYEGDWAAWLGGDSDLGTYIEQPITVPGSDPALTYWHWIDAPFGCDESRGGVTVDGVLVDGYQLCTATDTGGWRQRTVDLTAYAGQTVQLRFASQTTAANFGSLYIDAVSVHGTP